MKKKKDSRCTTETPAAGKFLRDLLIHLFIHSSTLPPFICSFMLPVLHLQSLSELLLFIRLRPSPSLTPFFPQQVAHVSSPALFTLIGQPIDRLSAGAFTQLRQLHEVGHSISCHIFHSVIKLLSTEWDFNVCFIFFSQSIQLRSVLPKTERISSPRIETAWISCNIPLKK